MPVQLSLPMLSKQERELRVPVAKQMVPRCHRAWQRAKMALQMAAQRSACKRHAAPTFHQGQRVWLATKDLPLDVELNKLAPRYIRPFKILRRINLVAYYLQLPSP